MLTIIVGLMVVAGLVLAGLAADVARRRRLPSGVSLAVLLLAVAWWCLTYALELSSSALPTKETWGDLKYAGVAVLAPAWLVFVLRYTGRGHLVCWRLIALLAVDPVVVMVLLLTPATHDLVKFYEASALADDFPVASEGVLFWPHFLYLNGLVLVATTLFVVTMVRVSRLYWRLSATLLAAALFPWVLNILFNTGVGPFAYVDLTPFAFVFTGGVLVWGLFRERLVKLTPVARSVVVETMNDAVLVLDVFRRVVDANPAAAVVLGCRPAELVGQRLADLLPGQPEVAPPGHRAEDTLADAELTLVVDGGTRFFDARRQPLHDQSGATAGELVVLRDITERKATETQLVTLLAERTRVAAALQSSLLPTRLPLIPGGVLAGHYQPAGDGHEIGGDFYDVFALGADAWGVVLGDVSGKGAEAAAVTAQIRYTLRTLASPDRTPSDVLAELNTVLLREDSLERYCTLAYGVVCPSVDGLRLTLCLGGHHPPLLRRDGQVLAVGRTGTALGLLDAPELHDTVVDLHPGDVVCLFTDGLIEARRGAELFDEGRAAEVLRETTSGGPVAVATALDEAARQFRGGPLSDDLALLVLEVIRPRAQAPSAAAGSAH